MDIQSPDPISDPTPSLRSRRTKVIAAIIVIIVLLGALFVGLYNRGKTLFQEELESTSTVSVEVGR